MNVYEEEFNGRVFVPSNIKEKKKTIIGKLDFRDILYIGFAGAIFVVVFFTLNKFLQNNVAFPIALCFCLPILFIGFMKFNGLKFEEYVYIMRANKLLSTKVRINNSDNLYEILEKNKEVKNAKRKKKLSKEKSEKNKILFFNFGKKEIKKRGRKPKKSN